MGLFDLFIKKKKHKKTTIYDEPIYRLYMDKKYHEVIENIQKDSSAENLSLEKKQLLALSYYYLKDYAHSLPLFEEISAVKNDVESSFNVLMSLMSSGQTEAGKTVFHRILSMHKGIDGNQPREMAMPFIRYYYAQALNDAGLFPDALIQLNELKPLYTKLKITDDTFLYMRGIPFFHWFLDLSHKVHENMQLDFSESMFLSQLNQKVDQGGKQMIEKYLPKKYQ